MGGVDALVVAFGAPELLDRCLTGLEGRLPVVVVDNSSDPSVRAVVERHGATYVDPGRNLGFGAGVNAGLEHRALTGDPVPNDLLLLNPDATITPDAVTRLRDRLHAADDLACVAPAVPVDSTRHVILACVGLVAGAATAGWTATSWAAASTRRRLLVGLLGLAVLGLAVGLVSTGHVFADIAHVRASAASSDRAHEWAAAFDVARHHLLLGVGTARVLLQWSVGGQVFTATFAHNEYLQLLVQDGVVGLGVLLVGLVWVFVRLAGRRRRAGAWSAECGIACLAALLAQSSLDFLWHIPVIPVLLTAVLALALAPSDQSPRRRAPAVTRLAPSIDTGG